MPRSSALRTVAPASSSDTSLYNPPRGTPPNPRRETLRSVRPIPTFAIASMEYVFPQQFSSNFAIARGDHDDRADEQQDTQELVDICATRRSTPLSCQKS